MNRRVGTGIVAVLLAVAAAATADHRYRARMAAVRPHPSPVAVVRPTVTVCTFADPASGIAISYPAGWHPTTSTTAELAVTDPVGTAMLSLDVPAMTFHPIFIPLGVVASRYVADLRRAALPDAAVQETADLTVAGASARRVTARGHRPGGTGGPCVDTAVVIVHKGQVYILSCDCDAADQQATRSVLDAAVASVRWTR